MELALEDHFFASRSLGGLAGRVAVLVYVGRRGAVAALRVGRSLHERFARLASAPAVDVIPVACLTKVPRLFHGMARGMLRRESPDVVAWIDFHGSLQRALGLRPDIANVAIVDPQGRLAGTHAGDFKDLPGVGGGRHRTLPPGNGEHVMPGRFWLIQAITILAGIALLFTKPTGRKPSSSVPWRGQIKPPQPPLPAVTKDF